MRSLVALLLVGLVCGQAPGEEVSFSAGLSHDATYTTQTTVVFDTVFTNIGSGYNPSTGIFTCPQSGIYLFQYHMLAELGSSGWLELYHNAYYINSIYAHSSDYASAGNSVILKITKGDTLQIKTVEETNGSTVLYGVSDEIYCTFSGYLLAPVQEEIPVG